VDFGGYGEPTVFQGTGDDYLLILSGSRDRKTGSGISAKEYLVGKRG